MVDPGTLWIESGGAMALRTAPQRLREAVGRADDKARYLGVLAAALTIRNQRTQDAPGADGAIEAAREALASMPAEAENRPWILTTLAVALASRYQQSGDLASLGEALALARSAAGLVRHPSVDAARGGLLAWAAHAHANRNNPRPLRLDLRGKDLRRQDLRDADLNGADLTGALLAGADLTGANLAGARLVGAQLDRACLVGAVLSGADLTGAWLAGADLTGAHLTAARVDYAVFAAATAEETALAEARCDRAAMARHDDLRSPVAKHPTALPTAITAVSDLVATAHEDGSVRLWDAATGMLLRECPGPEWSPVTGCTLTPVERCDEQDCDCADCRHAEEWIEVVALEFSPDGKRLATASRGETTLDYDVPYFAGLTVYDLGIGGDDGVWSADALTYDGDCERRWARPVELAFAPDSRTVAFGTHDPGDERPAASVADVHDVADGHHLWSLENDNDAWHRCVAFSPEGRLIAAGRVDDVLGEHTVVVHRTECGTTVARLSTGSEALLAMSFTNDGRVRAVTSGRARWSAWEWGPDSGEDGELWHREGTLAAAKYSPDGARLALVTDDRLTLCDAATGAPVWSLAAEAVRPPRAWSVDTETATSLRFSPDGRWLAAGTTQAVRVLDAATGAALAGTVRAVAFTPGGYWAIHSDGSVRHHNNRGVVIGDLSVHRASEAGMRVAGLRLIPPGELPKDPDD